MLVEINEEQASAMITAYPMLVEEYKTEADILFALGSRCLHGIAQEKCGITAEMQAHKERYSAALDMWASIKGAPLSYFELNKVCDLVKEFGKQWVLEAMEITGEQGKCKLGYTHTILNNWKTDGKGENEAFAKQESTVNDLVKKWND